jgi:hypothetical protein
MSVEKKIKELIDKGYLKRETIRDDQIAEHIKRARKDLETAHAVLAIDEEAAFNYAYLGWGIRSAGESPRSGTITIFESHG